MIIKHSDTESINILVERRKNNENFATHVHISRGTLQILMLLEEKTNTVDVLHSQRYCSEINSNSDSNLKLPERL